MISPRGSDKMTISRQVMLPDDLYTELEKEAKRLNRSIAYIMRLSMTFGLVQVRRIPSNVL